MIRNFGPGLSAWLADMWGVNGIMANMAETQTRRGRRRNRLPRGTKPVLLDTLRLSPHAYAVIDSAAVASGDLSVSLYLERLAHALEAQHGELPVLNTPVNETRGLPIPAA